MDAPSMVQRSGDTLIVRSVVSGDQLYFDQNQSPYNLTTTDLDDQGSGAEGDDTNSSNPPLPQCKIKRNYSCSTCTYFTQNPRHFLTHLRDIHYEKIVINECKHCLYASRHYQKLVRHMKMVHGSTDGLEEQALSRKRASQLAREQKKRKTIDCEDKVPLSLVHPSSHLQQVQQPDYFSPSPEFPNKLLKCTICDFTTLYRIKLVNHEREEHNKTKFFRCEKCSYVTHIKARFSKHVKYHSMPMIKCIMCDFRTPYKWNLDRHMKNHGGTGPYKCAACNFTADIKQSLTVHEMNHHVPPVGHASGMNMARRKNKVGGTDIAEQYSALNLSENETTKLSYTPDSIGNANNNLFIENLNEPVQKKMKYVHLFDDNCLQTNPTDLSQKSHTQISPNVSKKTSRPIPKLIPIQHTTLGSNMSTSSAHEYLDNLAAFSQRDINEICAKSQNSALKDLASLFISDEVFSGISKKRIISPSLSPSSSASSVQRKSSNFFEELKETLASGGKNEDNLVCQCGHLCKYLSELIIHQKNCGKMIDKQENDYPVNLSTSASNKSSIRCQYCRHRCKSSTDLYVHMQNCMEGRSFSDSLESTDLASNEKYDLTEDIGSATVDEENMTESITPHPMENVVFVWNKIPKSCPVENQNNGKDSELMLDAGINCESKMDHHHHDTFDPSEQIDSSDDNKNDDSSYYGMETAPGYGEVTKKFDSGEEGTNASLKKVFKCPHCSFWASTASRFHVHIVGHLNKKPFECSLCSYRSNWRWDITKHIRLKTIRDPSHKNARVLMNDETGRRNYTKYNKHITLMKVTDEDGDPKLLKSGEMTPSQVANLSFINESSEFLPLSKSRNSNEIIDINDDDAPENKASSDSNHDSNASYSNTDANDVSKPNSADLRYESIDEIKDEKPKDCKDTKKTSFKCKKCNFRHSNRDIVLTHVKGHYQEYGLVMEDSAATLSELLSTAQLEMGNGKQSSNSSIYRNEILSKIPLHLIAAINTLAAKTTSTTTTTATATTTTTATATTTTSIANDQDLSTATLKILSSNELKTNQQIESPPTTVSGSAISATSTDNGEVDEASSMGTMVTGWRDPAPYRCGHCHQVSNWKHVIQRHCRLKHNGDINIESIDKSSKKGVYHRLMSSSSLNTGGRINVDMENINVFGESSNSTNTTIMPSRQLTNTIDASINKNTSNIEQIMSHKSSTSSLQPQCVEIKQKSSIGETKLEDRILKCHLNPTTTTTNPVVRCQTDQLIRLLNQKPLKLTPGKNIIDCHISIDKSSDSPTNECQSKVDNVTGKDKDSPLKSDKQEDSCKEEIPNNSDAIDCTKSDIYEKYLLFCKYCPARFLNEKEIVAHLKLHASWFPYRCSACTFTSRHETCIEAHANVHTSDYVEKSKQLIQKFHIHPNYPQAHLTPIKIDDSVSGLFWTVSKYYTRNQKEKPQQVLNQRENDPQSTRELDLDDAISATKLPKKSYTNINKSSSSTPEGATVTGHSDTGLDTVQFQTTMEKQIRRIQDYKRHNQTSSSSSAAAAVGTKYSVEKCPHCPFCSTKPEILKDHMQYHICVSGNENEIICEHCDYSVSEESVLKEHIKLHFTMTPMCNVNNNIAFYTTYDDLVLTSIESTTSTSGGVGDADSHNGNKNPRKNIFPIECDMQCSSSNKENRVLIDITTGDVFKWKF